MDRLTRNTIRLMYLLAGTERAYGDAARSEISAAAVARILRCSEADATAQLERMTASGYLAARDGAAGIGYLHFLRDAGDAAQTVTRLYRCKSPVGLAALLPQWTNSQEGMREQLRGGLCPG
ncbi:MAG TPA: hypothetical protein PL033_01120 [Candidatus Brocadiia bacterium]|nr:hypothetical protein [Candidatus Brocadiia bacterium]